MSSYKLQDIIKSKWQRLASKENTKHKRSKLGHFVLYAREGKRRYVVPLKYLEHPIFKVLLEMAEEEFGNVVCGPLRVPCEEELMDRIVSLLRGNPRDDVENAIVSITSCRGAPVLSSFLTFCLSLRL